MMYRVVVIDKVTDFLLFISKLVVVAFAGTVQIGLDTMYICKEKIIESVHIQ